VKRQSSRGPSARDDTWVLVLEVVVEPSACLRPRIKANKMTTCGLTHCVLFTTSIIMADK
jgi:hypothetical protein